MMFPWLESFYLTLYKTFYQGVRFVVQIYLNIYKETPNDYFITEREWRDEEDNLVKLLKVKRDGHIRSFIFTEALALPYPIEQINWNEVIQFGNSILACLLNETDITEDIKRYSHYILYNYFFTVDDFINVTKNVDKSDEYKFTIIYSNLEEKQLTMSGQNSMFEISN